MAVLLRHAPRLLAAGLMLSALGGCGTLRSLSELGRSREVTPSSDPTSDPKWRPVTMPMPHPEAVPDQVNSLWRTGSRAFFKDQRAAQVGDVLTVVVSIADTAVLDNATSAVRTASETAGLPNLFGLETQLPKIISRSLNTSSLVSSSSANSNVGTGSVKRDETVTLRLAGVVTQVLPNGNLVISARQEVRVNAELRELSISGVVRPQDIASDNTVAHDRMAEARISYGGRGTLTQLQQPRIGQQILDILLPF